MKRLAVIIPAYKENFLFETLQSLANQTNKDLKFPTPNKEGGK